MTDGRRILRTLPRCGFVSLTSFAFVALGAATPLTAQFITEESFRFSEAPGWQFTQGNSAPGPRLTADSSALAQDPEANGFALDTSGQGWLRLATRTGNQANSAWLNSPIPSAGNNIKVGFDFTFWDRSGGTGADGITFFLADATVDLTPGGFGGSLGYANSNAIDGLTGGYLGLGLDVYGNYSNPTENRNGGVGFRPGEVVLRGPGSGSSGYEYLAGTDGTNTTQAGNPALDDLETTLGIAGNGLAYPLQNFRPDQDAEQYRYFEIELTDSDELIVRMRAGFDGPLVEVFTADVSAYARPDLLRIGFTAGTGGVNQVYEIRNLQVSATGATNTWYWTNADPTPWSENSNWSPSSQPVDHAEIVFSDQFPDTDAPMTVVVDGSDKTIRHVFFGSQHAYTIQPDSNQKWIFDSDGNGDSYLSILKTPGGGADHSVDVDIDLENDLRVQHFIDRDFTLGGDIATQGNDLYLNSFGTLEASGDISGSGDLTAQGSGLKILSGDNTHTGATTVEGGILQAASNNALGASGTGTTVEDGATLGLAGDITIASESLSLAGQGHLGSGALRNMEGSNTYAGDITLSADTKIAADSGSSLLLDGDINGSGNDLTFSPDATGTIRIDGTIGGSGTDLVYAGQGTTEIGYFADHTYTGTTTLRSGTVVSSSSVGNFAENAFGDSGTAIQLGDAQTGASDDISLIFNTLSPTNTPDWPHSIADREIDVNDFGNEVTLGVIGGDELQIRQAVNLSRDLTLSAEAGSSLVIRGDGAFNGELTGTGDITIAGGGDVTFSGNNSRTGDTQIDNGTLTVNNATDALDDAGRVTLANNADAELVIDSNEAIGSLAGGGASGGNVTVNTGDTLTIGADNSSNTYAGALQGGGDVTHTGSGTTTFTGSNTLSGTLGIEGGTIALGADNVFADSMGLTLDGGTFTTNGYSDTLGTLTRADASTLNFSSIPGSSLDFASMTGAADLSIDNWIGNLSGGGDSQFLVRSGATPGNLGNITFDGWGTGASLVGSSGDWEVVPDLSGFTEWSADHPSQKNRWDRGNNWTGAVPDSAGAQALIGNLDADLDGRVINTRNNRTLGTLVIANTTSANFGIANNTLTFDNNGSNANLTLIGNSSPTISSNISLADNLNLSNNSSGTLTFSGSTLATTGNNINVTGDGTTLFDSQVTGGGNLAYSGTGILRLNAANTHSGGTTLNDGTLQIGNNGALGSGTFDINGGTLQAFGAARSINNAFSINDGYAVTGSENLSFSGTGTVNTGDHAIDIASGLTHTLGGSLGGSGGITTTGDGTLALTGGSKTFSGGLTVDNGTVNATRGGNITLGAADGTNNIAGSGAITVNNDGSFNLTQSGNNAITLRGEALTNNGGTVTIDNIGNNAARDFLIGTDAANTGELVNLDGTTTINAGDDVRIRAGSSINVSGGSVDLNIGDAFITEGTGDDPSSIEASGDGSLAIDITGARSDENVIQLGQNDSMTVEGSNAGINLIGQADSAIDIDGRINLNNDGKVTAEQGTTTISATARVDGGSAATAGTLEVRDDLILAGNADITNAPNLTINTANDVSLSAPATGTSTKGWGTVAQEGTGTTTIEDSINNIDANEIVITDGTLMLGNDDQIANTTDMVLAGGTFNTNNNDEILGTLTLTADSVVDFGDIAGDGSILKFADSSGEAWDPTATLTVINWEGTFETGGGIDQLFFGTDGNGLTSAQRSQIVFADYPGNPAIHLPDGEVVPVPEPAAVASALGLTALICWRERRRLKRIWSASPYFGLARRHSPENFPRF